MALNRVLGKEISGEVKKTARSLVGDMAAKLGVNSGEDFDLRREGELERLVNATLTNADCVIDINGGRHGVCVGEDCPADYTKEFPESVGNWRKCWFWAQTVSADMATPLVFLF